VFIIVLGCTCWINAACRGQFSLRLGLIYGFIGSEESTESFMALMDGSVDASSVSNHKNSFFTVYHRLRFMHLKK